MQNGHQYDPYNPAQYAPGSYGAPGFSPVAPGLFFGVKPEHHQRLRNMLIARGVSEARLAQPDGAGISRLNNIAASQGFAPGSAMSGPPPDPLNGPGISRLNNIAASMQFAPNGGMGGFPAPPADAGATHASPMSYAPMNGFLAAQADAGRAGTGAGPYGSSNGFQGSPLDAGPSNVSMNQFSAAQAAPPDSMRWNSLEAPMGGMSNTPGNMFPPSSAAQPAGAGFGVSAAGYPESVLRGQGNSPSGPSGPYPSMTASAPGGFQAGWGQGYSSPGGNVRGPFDDVNDFLSAKAPTGESMPFLPPISASSSGMANRGMGGIQPGWNMASGTSFPPSVPQRGFAQGDLAGSGFSGMPFSPGAAFSPTQEDAGQFRKQYPYQEKKYELDRRVEELENVTWQGILGIGAREQEAKNRAEVNSRRADWYQRQTPGLPREAALEMARQESQARTQMRAAVIYGQLTDPYVANVLKRQGSIETAEDMDSALKGTDARYSAHQVVGEDGKPKVLRSLDPAQFGIKPGEKRYVVFVDDGPYSDENDERTDTLGVIEDFLGKGITGVFALSGRNLNKIPEINRGNIDNPKYARIKKSLDPSTVEAIKRGERTVNLFQVMEKTGMSVANHTFSHPSEGGKYFRDLSPEEQKQEIALNQIALAAAIKKSGASASILTNYVRISNSPSSDKTSREAVYRMINNLGLTPVEGVNYDDKGGLIGDYNDTVYGNTEAGLLARSAWAKLLSEKYYNRVTASPGIPIFFIHPHGRNERAHFDGLYQKLENGGYKSVRMR